MSETKPAELKPGMIVRFKPGAFEPVLVGGLGAWMSATYRPTRGELLGQFGNHWDVKPLDGPRFSQYVKSEHLISEGSTVPTTDNPELEAFKKKVRDAVIAEAKAQGWCERTNEWLEELGLEPWKKIPEAVGAVVECRDDSTCGTYYAVHKGYNDWQCFAGTTMRAYDSDIWEDFVSVVFDPSA